MKKIDALSETEALFLLFVLFVGALLAKELLHNKEVFAFALLAVLCICLFYIGKYTGRNKPKHLQHEIVYVYQGHDVATKTLFLTRHMSEEIVMYDDNPLKIEGPSLALFEEKSVIQTKEYDVAGIYTGICFEKDIYPGDTVVLHIQDGILGIIKYRPT